MRRHIHLHGWFKESGTNRLSFLRVSQIINYTHMESHVLWGELCLPIRNALNQKLHTIGFQFQLIFFLNIFRQSLGIVTNVNCRHTGITHRRKFKCLLNSFTLTWSGFTLVSKEMKQSIMSIWPNKQQITLTTTRNFYNNFPLL